MKDLGGGTGDKEKDLRSGFQGLGWGKWGEGGERYRLSVAR